MIYVVSTEVSGILRQVVEHNKVAGIQRQSHAMRYSSAGFVHCNGKTAGPSPEKNDSALPASRADRRLWLNGERVGEIVEKEYSPDQFAVVPHDGDKVKATKGNPPGTR
jgi:hypothetical protein